MEGKGSLVFKDDERDMKDLHAYSLGFSIDSPQFMRPVVGRKITYSEGFLLFRRGVSSFHFFRCCFISFGFIVATGWRRTTMNCKLFYFPIQFLNLISSPTWFIQ